MMTPDPENDVLTRQLLHHVRLEPSPAFVDRVMRGVRALPEPRTAGWFFGLRWEFPALALSMAGFALTVLYLSKPFLTADVPLFGDSLTATTSLQDSGADDGMDSL